MLINLRMIFVILMLALIPNVDARIDSHFSPNKENERLIVSLIDSAKVSVDMAAYSLTLDSVADALITAHQRGIKVRVLLDLQQTSVKRSAYRPLLMAKVPVKPDRYTGLMHSKYLIIDGKLLQTGSFNYTDNATYRNQENFLILDDILMVKSYEANFNRMWREN